MLVFNQKDAFVFELVVHYALIIPVYTNLPLLKFSHDAFFVLFKHTGDVAFGTCILQTCPISALHPEVFKCFENGCSFLAVVALFAYEVELGNVRIKRLKG